MVFAYIVLIMNILNQDNYTIDKGSFKNDATTKMSNFRPPFPLCHW